jgi:molybdenum cofactor biosynthesis enzyme MoaA
MQRSERVDAHTHRAVSKCVRAEAPAIQLSISIYDADLTDTVDDTSSIEQIAQYFDERAAPGSASLVRALGHCQRGDVYDASREFFAFLGARDQWFDFGFREDSIGCTVNIRERHVLAVFPEDATAAPFAFLEGYCSLSLNGRSGLMQHGALPPVVEALGLAVARHRCIQGNVDSAHALTHKLLTITRRSIYLRSAESAIGLLLKQEPVPPHLEKFVGIDRAVLAERFCPVPFARVDVHQGGEVAMCCTHWLPTNIGNVFEDTAENILNSTTAKDIRRSVVDGSFKYCSHTDCESIANDKLPFKRDFVGKAFDDDYYHIDDKILSDAFALKAFEIPNVSYLLFCLDRSCNLSCPSCRTDVIMVKGEERDRLYDTTERVVLPMLRNAKRVMINPSGEAFLSRPSRRLLEQLAEPGYENLTVDIITNGTLCDQAEWDKFAHLYRRIGYIRVSIDGASKAVIEKLRRGTKFEPLVENLNNLARMHKEGLFVNFFVSFTYQRDNLFEMEEFLRFAGSFGVSTIIFERLQNVGAFTPEEYQDRAVHLVDHPLHSDFIRTARRVKQNDRVYIDFDPGSAAD